MDFSTAMHGLQVAGSKGRGRSTKTGVNVSRPVPAWKSDVTGKDDWVSTCRGFQVAGPKGRGRAWKTWG